MPEPDRPIAQETVACDVCRKEIPRSEAKSAEGEDYILYFCGLECQDKWQGQRYSEPERQGR